MLGKNEVGIVSRLPPAVRAFIAFDNTARAETGWMTGELISNVYLKSREKLCLVLIRRCLDSSLMPAFNRYSKKGASVRLYNVGREDPCRRFSSMELVSRCQHRGSELHALKFTECCLIRVRVIYSSVPDHFKRFLKFVEVQGQQRRMKMLQPLTSPHDFIYSL